MTSATQTRAPAPVATPRSRSARFKRIFTPYGLSLAPVAVLVLFLVVPMFNVIMTSLTTPSATGSLTLENYAHVLSSSFYRAALLRTVTTGLAATGLTLLVSFPLALYLAFSSDRAKRYIALLVLTPLLVSVVVKGYALSVLLGPASPIERVIPQVSIDLLYTRWAVLLGFMYSFLPYMVLSINASLAGLDPRTITAARSLGAGAGYVLRRIVIPLSLPGVISGCVITCSLAMSSVALPLVLGGNGFQMWLYLVYQQVLIVFDWETGFTMSMILLILIVALLVAGNLLSRLTGRRTR